MVRNGEVSQSNLLTPGSSFGRLFWSLVCLISLLGVPKRSHAGTFTPSQMTFPALAVGQTSAPTQVTLTAGTSGTATATIVVTEGVTTAGLAEFAVANGGTCGSNGSLVAGQSCTVTMTFTPRYPGVRHGAVLLKTSGGTLLASSLISGKGQGGLPVFAPGQIDTVAGDGQWFYEGDGVPATQAPIYLPSGLVVDGGGNLYLADTINNRIRRVDAFSHVITTVAGNGNAGSQGNGGLATAAEVTGPSGLALDGAGNLYIADSGNNAIRRVDAVSGQITTVAGTLGQAGYTGDGGAATLAKLDAPQGVALTASGDLVIADTTNAAIRVVTMADGLIQTVAGTGTAGYNGDGISALGAQLNQPSSVALRSDGAIAIADLGNNRVRLMMAGSSISTVAGNGTLGYAGDNGPADQAELQGPAAVAFDPAGDLFIADSVNNCIRFVSGSQQMITTLSGIPSDDRFAGDGGPENQARMHGPDGLFFDAQGDLWFSDRFNNRVREVSGSLLTIGPYPTMKVGKTSQPIAEAMFNAGNESLQWNSALLQQAGLSGSDTTCGQGSLAPSMFCTMGVEFAPTNVGPSITGAITWNSDVANVTPIDQLYGQVLSVEPTSTAITSGANPGLLGNALTLTATIISDDTGRTGTVDFFEGSQTWCSSVPLAANGTAICQIASLSLGIHNFLANYSGDNNNAASQSPVFAETTKQQAALALGVSTSPAVVTSTVMLTVNAVDPVGIPSGTVTFYDGQNSLFTVALDSHGYAGWRTSSLSVGSHTLTAQYSGDGSNVAVTSPATVLEINQANTTIVLTSANSNATVGTSVTLQANVVSSSGPTPTGSVQFFDGLTSMGSGVLSGSGFAFITVDALVPGNHNLLAVYHGDADDATSTSTPIVQVIQQIGTGTTLSADAEPLYAGATLHLKALTSLLRGATANGPLTGVITFHEGGYVLGSAPLDANGGATLPVGVLGVGTHGIIASFSGSTNYAVSDSIVLNETVQQTPSMTSLSSTSSTTLKAKPASFSVVVTSATGTPTGTVTFKDGANLLGTSSLNSSGLASFSIDSLSAGVHAITALYNGDANYLSSSSPAVQQTVSLAQATLVLSGPTNTVDAGTAAAFLASLSTPGSAPTGTVMLLDGSTVLGTSAVHAAGNYVFATSQLLVGVHRVSASYSGDANNAAALSPSLVVTVAKAKTQTGLLSSVNPLTKGEAPTLTATVSSDSPNESGSVTFYDGIALLGTASLQVDGTAQLSPQSLALGLHSIQAIYSGDDNHTSSASVAVPELVVQKSYLSVSSSVNPSISGSNVIFSAQVQGSPTPTGNVTMRDNGVLVGIVALGPGGFAVFGTPSLSVGTHTINFIYGGDNNFSVASADLAQSVMLASTQTILTASANPGTYGQALTLAAAVTSNGGAATGTMSFSDGGAVLGSAQLGANGYAALTLSNLAPGPHSLVANYLGDGKAISSSSTPLAISVKQVTSLRVSSDSNPGLTLSPITLTAAVLNPGAALASGTITFNDGANVLGSVPVNSAGFAALTLQGLKAGMHAILATYAGDDANFGSQSAVFRQAVQLRSTTTTITGTPTDASNPQQITLIAVVHGNGYQSPSGVVNFTSGSVNLGTAPVDGTGVASITIIFEVPTQQVVSSYMGDDAYAASQSSSTAISAGSPAQFTLGVNTPVITLISHQHLTVSVDLASIKGYSDTIALGCIGLPFAATCTFTDTQLKLKPNGSATTSLILDTGDPLGAGSSTSAALERRRMTLYCLLPAGLALGSLLRRSRRKQLSFLLVLLFGFLLSTALSGCGGLQMSGTPPGTYSFRVIGTGQGSSITEAQTVSLVVTQ